MGEYDATQVWDYEMSSHDYLEESYTCRQEDTWDLDDDYGRDSTDWQQMAYIHFAWELVRVSHYTIVFHTFGKIVWQFDIGILYYYSQQDPLLRPPAVILKKLSRPWTVSELSIFYANGSEILYIRKVNKHFQNDSRSLWLQFDFGWGLRSTGYDYIFQWLRVARSDRLQSIWFSM